MVTKTSHIEELAEAEADLDQAECNVGAKQQQLAEIDRQIAQLVMDRDAATDELIELLEINRAAQENFNRIQARG